MKFIKTILSVIGVDSALASEVEEELQHEDKSLAKLLQDQDEEQKEIDNEAKNHQRCQRSEQNSLHRC